MKKIVTIAIPVYNEQGNLGAVFERVQKLIDSLPKYRFEVILIDNHSTDDSPSICQRQTQLNPQWKYVRFSRNFGIEASFYAGSFLSQGDALVYLFSDLQDPPENIPQMLVWWEKGYDVVYGVLKERKDHTIFKSWGAHIAYRLIYHLSDIKIPINATDFRLISRPVIDALKNCDERTRYMRGLTHWSGFQQKGIEFQRVDRVSGLSSAGLWFCIKYAINAMLAFSTKPIQMASLFGLSMMGVSILGSILYIVHTVLTRNGWTYITPPPPGWTTIVLLIFFFGGTTSLFLGILGQYISQIHQEVKARPIWISEMSIGFDSISSQLANDYKTKKPVIFG